MMDTDAVREGIATKLILCFSVRKDTDHNAMLGERAYRKRGWQNVIHEHLQNQVTVLLHLVQSLTDRPQGVLNACVSGCQESDRG